MNNELIPTNLVIGDRTYRVRIHPDNEEVVRKTVKVINDKLVEYKTMFAGKDMQDYIAMVLVWFATEQKVPTTGHADIDQISNRLQNLTRIIEETLEAK